MKEKLILANKLLDVEGLARPLGHISVRIPNTETFLITRNVAPGMAVLDDIVVCNLEGKVIEGKYPKTFSEVVIHSEIYKKRKDVQSVAHTHSLHVIALSMTETSILPASFEAIELGAQPIAIYKKIAFIDKPEQASEICDLLGPNKAVMLKGHGAVVVGKSIEETAVMSSKLELTARLQLLASSAGKIVSFTEEEKKPVVGFLDAVEKRGGTSTSYGRAWLYYEHTMK
jgi:ribulose-5-phosphate 4-epimerase/fuculose-1-phosphate aldolase